MPDTRDCNICADRNCAVRPRLGEPVIFNCPKFKSKHMLNVGDYFWEYNSRVGYKRKAHSAHHVAYFRKGYGTRAFFTVEELLAKYPNAEVTEE